MLNITTLPALIRLKYLTEVNRWTRLAGPVALLHEATGGDLSRSLVWSELLHRYDVVDIASAVFTDQFGCWGFLDLWRTGASGRFTPSEASFLAGGHTRAWATAGAWGRDDVAWRESGGGGS